MASLMRYEERKKTVNKAFKSDSQRLAVSLRSSIAKRRSHLNAATWIHPAVKHPLNLSQWVLDCRSTFGLLVDDSHIISVCNDPVGLTLYAA